jgi:hypothetical protein
MVDMKGVECFNIAPNLQQAIAQDSRWSYGFFYCQKLQWCVHKVLALFTLYMVSFPLELCSIEM